MKVAETNARELCTDEPEVQCTLACGLSFVATIKGSSTIPLSLCYRCGDMHHSAMTTASKLQKATIAGRRATMQGLSQQGQMGDHIYKGPATCASFSS